MSEEQLTIPFGLYIPYLPAFWSKVYACQHGWQCRECCWTWLGARNPSGYGNFNTRKIAAQGSKYESAYRHAYRFMFGDVPEGLHLDHLRRNPPCVNGWHLEPVPQRINTLRSNSSSARRARSDYCLKGHLFDEENTFYDYYYDKKRGKQRIVRKCRICINERAREEYRRNDGWARKQRLLRKKAAERSGDSS